MNIPKTIKRLILEQNTNQTELAVLLGITRSNFASMLLKKDFRIHSDIEKIANALNYDIKLIFVDRDSGKEIEAD